MPVAIIITRKIYYFPSDNMCALYKYNGKTEADYIFNRNDFQFHWRARSRSRTLNYIGCFWNFVRLCAAGEQWTLSHILWIQFHSFARLCLLVDPAQLALSRRRRRSVCVCVRECDGVSPMELRREPICQAIVIFSDRG